jgi:hypothetical protein
LIYDPSVAVEHDVAPRHAGDALHRGVFAQAPLVDAVHNETVAVIEGRGRAGRAGYLAWALLVGTGEAPGVAQCARLMLRGDAMVWQRWRAAVAGRRLGAATAHRMPRSLSVPRPPT